METIKQRLSKVLASAGIASRRASEELIFSGAVQVNSEVIKIPQTLVDVSQDDISVNGQKIAKEEKVYYILNKPIGYVCSNLRKGKTKLVIDLFEGVKERLFTVGRLDKNTGGLLLVTNDGHFAQQIIHPSANLHKEYLVKTDHEISYEHLIAIAAGTRIGGSFIQPKSVKKVRKGTIKITVAEGKKHEVRLLLEVAGLQVKSLTRIRIGGLSLGNLPVGSWREMTENEKAAIPTE